MALMALMAVKGKMRMLSIGSKHKRMRNWAGCLSSQSPSAPCLPSSIRGFSLIEMLVVLVIIGISSAVVVPRLVGSMSNVNLKAGAKRIAAPLRYARSQAISRGVICVAVFDFEKNRISIVIKKRMSGPAREKDNGNEQEKEKESVDSSKSYDLPDGVRLKEAVSGDAQIDSGVFKIVFFPSGNSSGGEVILANDRGRQYSISVDFITGTVKLREVTG